MGYPPMDGLQWKIPLKWMIWGYPYFRKPPNGYRIEWSIKGHGICLKMFEV